MKLYSQKNTEMSASGHVICKKWMRLNRKNTAVGLSTSWRQADSPLRTSQALIQDENSLTLASLHRGVEQLVAHRAHNPKVVGSNPTPATRKAQAVIVCAFSIL